MNLRYFSPILLGIVLVLLNIGILIQQRWLDKVLIIGHVNWGYVLSKRDVSYLIKDLMVHGGLSTRYVYNQKYSTHIMTDCPEVPSTLKGNVSADFTIAESQYYALSDLPPPKTNRTESLYMGDPDKFMPDPSSPVLVVKNPSHCRPLFSVAIIIPFRYREYHLRCLLSHIVPILQRQLIRYTILVVHQHGNDIFNKGRLMNTGFEYLSKAGKLSGTPFDCFIFQDVDLLVESDALLYRCSGGNTVNHLSVEIDKFDYEHLSHGITVGGVVAFTEEQFRKVNGYPNSYWGWGAEDDDMMARISHHGIGVVRPSEGLGRYSMIRHNRDDGNNPNANRMNLLHKAKVRFDTDGLGNLNTRIIDISVYPLYTNITVNVGIPVEYVETEVL